MIAEKHQKSILLTITSLAPGGAEKQCLLLAKILQDHYHVHLVVIDDAPQHQGHLHFMEEHGLLCTFLAGGIFQKIKQLRHLLRELSCDLILSYLPKDIMIASLANIFHGAKHIGGIRNANMPRAKRRALRMFHNHMLTASVSNSHSGKKFFAEDGFREKKITVIPNGIAIPSRKHQQRTRDLITISTLGRLVEQKDFGTALKAFDYLLSKVPNPHQIELRIVGSGEEESKLREKTRELGIQHNVIFITNAHDMQPILESTDIYLCTSLFEGLSNAVMEAMTYCLPIVATEAGDNDKLVLPSRNGYICALQDEIGIGNALLYLVESPERREAFGKCSFDHIKSNYNLERFANRYLSLLAEHLV